jgi:cell wall-associated NlpC family hydrolase
VSFRARLLRTLLAGVLAAGTTLTLSVPAAAADPSLADIQAQIKKDSTALEKVVEQYDKVGEQLKANNAKVAALAAQIKPLADQVSAASAEVDHIAATAYKGGNLTSLSAVMTADSPQLLLDRLASLDQLTKNSNAKISAYQATKASLEAEKATEDAAVAATAKQQQDLASQRRKIEADLAKLQVLRKKVYGALAQERTYRSTATAPYVAGAAGVAVRYAYNALGTPYVWAADGPNGYDCSGLTMAAWRAAGKSLPHNAAMQWDVVAHIGRSSLMPGDLVFYSSLGHVALYVGNNQVIHAPTFGEVVKISSVDMMTPYGYGRVR